MRAQAVRRERDVDRDLELLGEREREARERQGDRALLVLVGIRGDRVAQRAPERHALLADGPFEHARRVHAEPAPDHPRAGGDPRGHEPRAVGEDLRVRALRGREPVRAREIAAREAERRDGHTEARRVVGGERGDAGLAGGEHRAERRGGRVRQLREEPSFFGVRHRLEGRVGRASGRCPAP